MNVVLLVFMGLYVYAVICILVGAPLPKQIVIVAHAPLNFHIVDERLTIEFMMNYSMVLIPHQCCW